MTLRSAKHLFIIMLASILLITACGKATISKDEKMQDKGIGGGDKIIVRGLDMDEIVLKLEEIKAFPPTTRDVTAVTSDGGEESYEVRGTLLDDFLQDLGFRQSDLAGMRLVAGDGYSVEIPREILHKRDIILTYEMDGGPIPNHEYPVRAVIPEERAMYWVANLQLIEILREKEELEASKIYFLEVGKELLDMRDYPYGGQVDQAISNQNLLDEFSKDMEEDTVFIRAIDGLEKNETISNFRDAYIKITGEDVPAFMSPDMPLGMTVKEILFFKYGDIVWFSFDRARDKFEPVGNGDPGGIKIVDILGEIDLEVGGVYTLTGLDGFQLDVDWVDLDQGILYENQRGLINIYFPHLPKNTEIRDLLSIETK